jgi:hypothetical protein
MFCLTKSPTPPPHRFVSYVDSLPSSAPPDVFGLHPNADISKVGNVPCVAGRSARRMV